MSEEESLKARIAELEKTNQELTRQAEYWKGRHERLIQVSQESNKFVKDAINGMFADAKRKIHTWPR